MASSEIKTENEIPESGILQKRTKREFSQDQDGTWRDIFVPIMVWVYPPITKQQDMIISC